MLTASRRWILLTGIVLALAGCGGGGGGGGRSYYTVQGNVVSYASTGLVLGITLASVSNNACMSSSPTTQTITQTEASYTFPASNGDQGYPNGTSYTVCVVTQPATQNCTVANPTGVVRGDVIGVNVSCSTPNEPVKATVTGLVGSGLTLQLTGNPTIPVSTSGATLGTVPDGNTYLVTLTSLPTNPAQTCALSAKSTNGSAGTIGGSAANPTVSGTVEGAVAVTIACTPVYSIGGTVTGMSAFRNAGLVLTVSNDSTMEEPINSDGPFTLNQLVASGATYAVSVQTQPTYLGYSAESPSAPVYCTVQNVGGSGTMGSGPVTNVQVVCRPIGQSLALVYNDVGVPSGGGLAIYDIAQAGALTPQTGSPFEPTNTEIFAVPSFYGYFYASVFDAGTGTYSIQGYNNYNAGSAAGNPTVIDGEVEQMAANPSGAFLVVSDYGSSTEAPYFAIYNTGGDTPAVVVAPIAASVGNVTFVTDPNNPFNTFIYVTGDGFPNNVTTGYIWGFLANVSSTPTVQPITGSPWATGLTPGYPTSYATTIDPSTKFLVAGGSSASGNSGQITAFNIGSGGLLTPMANGTYSLTQSASALAFDASSQFLYVLGRSPFIYHEQPPSTLFPFTVDATKGLAAKGAPIALLTDATGLSIDPSGTYLYLVPSSLGNDDGLYFFKIDAANNGALTQEPNIQLANGVVASQATLDPSGKFMFIGDSSTPQNIYEYLTNPDNGTLEPSPMTINTGLPSSLLDQIYVVDQF